MYKIDKNKEVYKKNKSAKSNLKYPWPDMDIGDSFFVPDYSHKKESTLITVGNSWASRNKPEMKVCCRKEGDGIRVYRIT